ncbi:MAG: hypothetical protein K0R49_988, partial [Burkholderiales bacterium]|nr:hypothetical protein [Burkholderiales bacterium]
MNKKQRFLLSGLTVASALFISAANAQVLNYSTSSHGLGENINICNNHAQCASPGRIGRMETGNAFCAQFNGSSEVFLINDISQEATIMMDSSTDSPPTVRNLQNATQVSNSNTSCQDMDPAPNAGIAYKISNSTTEPITFLQIFTTENNGTTPCSGCTNWWQYWHNDKTVSLEPGTVLQPNEYFPSFGWTGWYDAASKMNGTRWFIKYSHGNDCFITTPYNPSGQYPDQTNLCDYNSKDLQDQKFRPAALDIRDGKYIIVFPP